MLESKGTYHFSGVSGSDGEGGVGKEGTVVRFQKIAQEQKVENFPKA